MNTRQAMKTGRAAAVALALASGWARAGGFEALKAESGIRFNELAGTGQAARAAVAGQGPAWKQLAGPDGEGLVQAGLRISSVPAPRIAGKEHHAPAWRRVAGGLKEAAYLAVMTPLALLAVSGGTLGATLAGGSEGRQIFNMAINGGAMRSFLLSVGAVAGLIAAGAIALSGGGLLAAAAAAAAGPFLGAAADAFGFVRRIKG